MPAGASPPLVTALITNWNYGRFLREAIDSALGQDYPHLEVVVVDDGSTDDSREILAGYAGRVRTIFRQRGGQAAATNTGVEAARGEILCFLDADDAWLTDKVASVVETFRQEACGLVCHDLLLRGSEGVAVSGRTWCEAFHVTLRSGDLLRHLQETAFEWVFSPTSGLSVAADLLRLMGPIPEDWTDGPDSAIANVAASLRPVGVVGRPLGFYRLHGTNRAGVADPPPWFFKLENLAKRPRRIAHVRSVLARLGLALDADPLAHYPFLRDWCFITQGLPLAWLPRLGRANLAYRRRAGQGGRAILAALASDALVAALISLRLSPRYREYRRLWRARAGPLTTSGASGARLG